MRTHHQIETRDPQQRDSLVQLRGACGRDNVINFYDKRLQRTVFLFHYLPRARMDAPLTPMRPAQIREDCETVNIREFVP